MTRVIGLISGTSVDGIDAALIEVTGLETDLQVTLQAGETYPYPEDLRAQILAVGSGAALSMAELADLDDVIAHQFAQAARSIQQGHPPAHLIGSHGQTVFHRPPESAANTLGYSLQLGRGEVIAHRTGIPTVSNFRVADIAVGGQGAPLVPRVDAYLFSHPTEHRCVQNIGGIGNVAYLPPRSTPAWEQTILGWDTGPGNMLIDLAVQHLSHGQLQYDQNGEWAAQGTPSQKLVQQWLQQDFFQQPPPKSTGREHFGSDYLHRCLQDATGLSPADLLATLTDFTAATIAHSYQTYLPQQPDQVFICGGGSRNLYLKQRLAAHLHPTRVLTTDEVGISADFKEAIAFAVLAYWRTHETPGNLPGVTGAKRSMLLGEFHTVP